MKLKCAWCEREGRPASLADVEPFDNRSETHGLCREHYRQWLESLGLGDSVVAPPPPQHPLRPSA
jgi:hypothetical protein